MNFDLFRVQEEDDYSKAKQWPAARLTRSATLPRKSRVAGSSYLACSSGGGGSSCSQPDKTPTAKKTYPSSGSSGYNSLPRMNGGGRKFGGGKNSPSELSYKTTAAKASAKAAEEDRDACKPNTPTGRGSNFDSSYSCDEISVNNCSIALTATPPPPVKAAKTAADLRREYFRGTNKYGSATGTGNNKDQQLQQKQHYFNRGGGGLREKQAIASSLHKYFDNACKIK